MRTRIISIFAMGIVFTAIFFPLKAFCNESVVYEKGAVISDREKILISKKLSETYKKSNCYIEKSGKFSLIEVAEEKGFDNIYRDRYIAFSLPIVVVDSSSKHKWNGTLYAIFYMVQGKFIGEDGKVFVKNAVMDWQEIGWVFFEKSKESHSMLRHKVFEQMKEYKKRVH